jgi:hypothetical protein
MKFPAGTRVYYMMNRCRYYGTVVTEAEAVAAGKKADHQVWAR